MPRFQRFWYAIILGITAALTSLMTQPGLQAADRLPTRPANYVLDETHAFSSSSLALLHSLLAEHERLTGEQILIAVLKNHNRELPALTRDLALSWEIGRANRGNGILILAVPEKGKGIIQAGYGLEGILAEQLERIQTEAFVPFLEDHRSVEAVATATYEVLKVLESPLVANGKAEAALHEITKDLFKHQRTDPINALWLVLLIAGTLIAGAVLSLTVSHEAHYTGSGWFRPRPWQLIQLPRFKKSRRDDAVNVEGTTGVW